MRSAGTCSRFIPILMLAAAMIAARADARSAAAPGAGGGEKALRLRFEKTSDAVVLYDSLIVSYDAGGRISKRRHREVMLLTDNAINRYGDPRILWNAATQDLSILAARVRMRDGTAVDVQKNAVNRTTPFSLDAAPEYADWQETVVTHMGVEKGCVAELHYVIADRNASPYLSGVEVFGAEDPTVERTLVVKLPPRMNLRFAPLNDGMPAPGRETGDVWAWTVRDIPGRTPVAGGVWEGDYLPAVCYSTAASWRDALAPIGKNISDKTGPVSPDLSRIIKEKAKGHESCEDVVLAVQRFGIENMRSVSVPYPLLAAPARDAARVYDTGYASALDGAVLLMAMLKELGFAPSCALVSAGRTLSNDVPAPELCRSILVAVPTDDAGEMLLDPSTPLEHDPAFSLAGRTLVHLGDEPRLSSFPSRRIGDSRSELTLDLSPGADGGLAGKGTAILEGAFSPYYLVREGESGLADFLKKRVSGFFGGAEITAWNPRSLERDKAEIDFTFTVKLPERKKGERVYLTMPKPLESRLSGIERLPLERSRSADVIGIEPCSLSARCTIELPAGWKMLTEHFSTHGKEDIGEASVRLAAEPDGKQLFIRHLLLASDRVPPESFDRFRSLLTVFAEDRIVLERE